MSIKMIQMLMTSDHWSLQSDYSVATFNFLAKLSINVLLMAKQKTLLCSLNFTEVFFFYKYPYLHFSTTFRTFKTPKLCNVISSFSDFSLDANRFLLPYKASRRPQGSRTKQLKVFHSSTHLWWAPLGRLPAAAAPPSCSSGLRRPGRRCIPAREEHQLVGKAAATRWLAAESHPPTRWSGRPRPVTTAGSGWTPRSRSRKWPPSSTADSSLRCPQPHRQSKQPLCSLQERSTAHADSGMLCPGWQVCLYKLVLQR